MRIYEYSKKHNVSAKDIIALMQDAGFDVKSHMSVLDEKGLEFLNKKFEKKSKATKTPKKIVVKKEEAKPVKEKKAEKPATKAPKKEEVKKSVSEKKASEKKKKIEVVSDEIVEEASHEGEIVVESMLVTDFAQKVDKPVTDLIVTLLKMGVVASKNQVLSEEVVARLAKELGFTAIKPKVEVVGLKDIDIKEGVFKERSPVVVVLGHVDHGKTTLLDYIRKTRVAAREKGGITQHLGAYEVPTKQGDVIFLDTPGHEAFYKIRGRGAGVADIAILMIAADDGVMPQTIEAIKHIKAAGLPVIVALNKVDKVEPGRVEAVKQTLTQYDLLPEEWGGDVIVVPVSAKFGQGVDSLLEMIILQAQVMELKSEVEGPAKGYILESRPEKGRGSVGTLLSQHGKVKIGDYFVCGNTRGKVSSITDSVGRRLKEVGPCIPVRIAGFDALPEVGDLFEVVSQAEYRQGKSKDVEKKPLQCPVIEGALNLLIKADTNSSKEALLGAIAKLSQKLKKEFNIIHAGVGNVSESDVMLAENTGAVIFSFHVKVEPKALVLAQRYDVIVRPFDIIYKLLESLEELVEKGKEVKKVLTKIGEAVVRKVFDIKGVGVIAGCYVRDGRISRNGIIEIWRGPKKIGSGPIRSLQRERKPLKEVHTGFECGFVVEGFTDWEIDDVAMCFLEIAENAKK